LQDASNVPRCLIVDDDRDGREGFAEYLRAFGFDVIECADGEAGWECLARMDLDIVLLDLRLPRLSGWDLVRRLRHSKRHAGLPVVAFSACAFPEDRERAEEVGCDVFITKPAAPGDVLAELRKLLSQSRRRSRPNGTANATS
jgi:DNA-binding response OmpR family regulator